MVTITGMSEGSKRTLLAMHVSDGWLTVSEMNPGASAMALTLMATRCDPWVQRRQAHWGCEEGQKRGKGYEYRLTPLGREYRDAVVASTRIAA